MPASLLTARHKWVNLKVDDDLPESSRPMFRVRPLTVREQRDIRMILADTKGDELEEAEARIDAIGCNFVTGWRNLRVDDHQVRQSLGGLVGDNGDIPFSDLVRAEVLNAILSSEEANELGEITLSAYSLKDTDRGNSQSPALSQQASSASNATVKTDA